VTCHLAPDGGIELVEPDIDAGSLSADATTIPPYHFSADVPDLSMPYEDR
jgi:hypothetical protein